MSSETDLPAPEQARRLARAADRAALSTLLARETGQGWPYGSLVTLAWDYDLSPLLVLSDLSDHSRNLKADPRASLLIAGPSIGEDPLASPRLTLLGRAVETPKEGSHGLRRFLARHPYAFYAGFGDFRLFRLEIASGHLVGGFGKVAWMTADKLRAAVVPGLAEVEEELIEEINRGATGNRRVTGIDSEGVDLRIGAAVERASFAKTPYSLDDLHREIDRLDLWKS
jgi:putative heme iron utilization protein